MNNSQIIPERVTRPIQLLAAWLTGLIVVDGSFLIAATQISAPPWASGALVIAAIINVPLFLISIFLLQTKYRPEMQEDTFYAKYLDKQYSDKAKIPDLPDIDKLSKTIADEIVEKLDVSSKSKIEVVEKIVRDSQLEQVAQRLGGLRTISELYLSPNTWESIVHRWEMSEDFKQEIKNLLKEQLIIMSGNDYTTCKLTNLGLQVAQLAQQKELLFQQKKKSFWEDEHSKKRINQSA